MKIFQDKNIINLVTFYSEGIPHDNGLNLSINKDIILQQIKHFNNISIYTPTILRNLGMNECVKEYENTGLVSMNPGMSKIGFSATQKILNSKKIKKKKQNHSKATYYNRRKPEESEITIKELKESSLVYIFNCQYKQRCIKK